LPAYVKAATCLLTNASFIAAETIAWIKVQNPGFAYADADGLIQWEKAIQLFSEAVIYDITYGGIQGSATQANQYWISNVVNGVTLFASTIDSSEIAVKISSLEYAKGLAAQVASNNTPSSLYQASLSRTASFVSKTLVGSNYDVVLSIPTRVIPIQVGSAVTVSGNSRTQYNGTYTVVASGTESVTLRYSSDPGVWSILTVTEFVIAQTIDTAFSGGGGASAVLLNGQILVVAGGGAGAGGSGNGNYGLATIGTFNSSTSGAQGQDKSGDGGGGGGGGGGYPLGGAGGTTPGGDAGAYSGTTGQSILAGGSLSTGNNGGDANSGNGGNGSVFLSW
jgi:hypothetical protein